MNKFLCPCCNKDITLRFRNSVKHWCKTCSVFIFFCVQCRSKYSYDKDTDQIVIIKNTCEEKSNDGVDKVTG